MSGALADALVSALATLTVIEKGRTANAGSYSYDYADIADVVKLTRPKLAEHGIVALTPVHAHEGGLACTVKLLHTSGESLDLGPFPFPAGRDAQATGSMVTYHRRYALVAALGLAAGDDDDGHAATQSARQPAPPKGITSKELGEQIKDALQSYGIDDPDGDHAKAIWKAAQPKAVQGVITEEEQERVMAVCADRLGDHIDGGEPF